MSHVEAYSGRRDPINCPANQPPEKPVKRRRVRVRGVRGYGTVIHGKDDFVEGDLLCYDRVLTAAERKRVVAYLKKKGAIR